MFWVLWLLVVAVLGGVIAFVGDRVGMRVGRKRLTLFGVRPKYTSMGIAVLTGVFTALCTLGILSAVSKNVRIAVFHLAEIRKDLSETTSKNLRLKTENTLIHQDLLDVSKKWKSAQVELAGVNDVLSGLRTKISSLIAARDRTEQALVTAKADLNATAADLAKVKEQYNQVNGELAAAKNDVKFIQQRKDNLESAIAVLESQIENLSTQRQYFVSGVVDFATQPIILHVGEVVAAEVVKPGKTFPEIEGVVVELLNRADKIARERGAVIENKGVGTRVDIKRLTGAYQLLFNLKKPAVLRVISGTNAIAGKPAFIYLDVLQDDVVFRQGETIASIVVDNQYPQDEILALVVGELLPDARKAAAAKGMVNVDGETPAPSLVFANLQQVLAAVAAANGHVKLKLVAARDLWLAGDRLSLRAVVGPE